MMRIQTADLQQYMTVVVCQFRAQARKHVQYTHGGDTRTFSLVHDPRTVLLGTNC